MLKILVFGSRDCEACEDWLSKYSQEEFPEHFPNEDTKYSEFTYIDAEAEENTNICDIHDIDIMPRVKVFDSHNRILFDKEGFFEPKLLWNVLFPTSILRKKAQELRDNIKKS